MMAGVWSKVKRVKDGRYQQVLRHRGTACNNIEGQAIGDDAGLWEMYPTFAWQVGP